MRLMRLWPVRRHDLFGLGGWGPGPPRLAERRDSAETSPPRQAKNPGRPEKLSPRSRRADGCCQRQVGKAHAQLPTTGHGTIISRIMAPSQQGQIGSSRVWPSRRSGASRWLSGKARHRPGTSRSSVR